MKTKLFILLLFVASCRTTSEPKSSIQSSQPSYSGTWEIVSYNLSANPIVTLTSLTSASITQNGTAYTPDSININLSNMNWQDSIQPSVYISWPSPQGEWVLIGNFTATDTLMGFYRNNNYGGNGTNGIWIRQ